MVEENLSHKFMKNFSTDHNLVNRGATSTGIAKVEPVINSTQVQQFTFPLTNQTVRIVDINGVPHWIAKDVCEVLDYNNVGMAVYRLDDDEKGVSIVYTLGGNQKMIVINESGLWSLIMTSRKPEAKPFQKWVTSEVLPTIRKTGGYGQQKQEIPDFSDPAVLNRFLIQQTALGMELKANVKQLEEKNTKLVTENVDLHDHLDALGLGAVYDRLFSP